ncbi:MAG: aminopeptidase P family protein [Alphaproteobacteria bacterium]|nr:aminopeptidase P family protein [Alphaproteobacteria bacterium]
MCKLTEVAENRDLSLADEVRSFYGREPEDPIDVFRVILGEKARTGARIGLEAAAFYLRPQHYVRLLDILGPRHVDATALVEEAKLVKSAEEIAYIKRAAEVADAGTRKAIEHYVAGRGEFGLSAEVNRTMIRLGSDAAPSPMNLASGERSCYGHGLPTERELRDGDFAHIEFGASNRRYCATIGRQFCLGRPNERMSAIYGAAREGADAASRPCGPACRRRCRTRRPNARSRGAASTNSACTPPAMASRPAFRPRGRRTSKCSPTMPMCWSRAWCCQSSRRCSSIPSGWARGWLITC